MYTNQPHVIYQSDSNWQHELMQKRDMLMGTLHPHVGRTLRVTTLDGHTYEGVLVNVDGHHVYLQVTSHGQHHGQHRPIYTPAQYNQIMTLVLFELLVIVLLS
ncbi:hypothetical protein GCM10008018_28160 [Paenibacillus marchantiophytorum]|uniref:DUF2642 domain-containing protein n=1 Tax=Paenibacillus marchantiophytorum TaxID=1619310 RepID=A0ABQ1EPY7_9BACL|nr:hypothetical protein [Paenibacillus marchantiophytorum]GFZ81027.1 hypothetical protein GCM10008018_28160 [Paenibacillus marchantiophytorum]